MSYDEFLASKVRWGGRHGFTVVPAELHPDLKEFQRHVVVWALRRGRSAIWGDTGTGKTVMQLEWARKVVEATGGSVLIFAPLAVSAQTVREASRFGISASVVRDQTAVGGPGIYVTNYEMLHHFTPEEFSGVVIDESSILKGYDGKFRARITDFASVLRFRLACTATPAPNDLQELANHAAFLGIMSDKEMLALFFRQDGNTTHRWRLKKHAEDDFWRWLASWAVSFRHPRDTGYDTDGYDLPELTMREHVVAADTPDGLLFPVEATGLMDRRRARRASLDERVELARALVEAEPEEQWLVWCDLNAESEALTAALPESVQVTGSDSSDHKARALLDFADGKIKRLVSKPSICGHGMNWQNCARMVFVGLSDSYEQLYQATRRCWRFGQTRPVHAHIIIGKAEGAVLQNIRRKERQADEMFSKLVAEMRLHHHDEEDDNAMDIQEDHAHGDGWTLLLGDCMERIREIDDETVGLTVFSPPFPSMYAYTDSVRDVGNVKNSEELIEHFSYLMPELLRVTIPSRLCAIHLTQEPVFKHQAGYVGRRDFRGKVIERMEMAGWRFSSEVTIDKDPQIKAARTKEHTLLFKTLATDSVGVRPCLADYLLIFHKLGANPDPIQAGIHERYQPGGGGWITQEEWIEWAAPVWYRQTEGYPGGIRETDVLSVREARDEKDERHLCPLQLGVIERTVKLWSNPGDLVLSPFAGIGSEGYVAIQLGRRFTGIELKRSYWEVACKNLEWAEKYERKQMKLSLGTQS